MAKVRVGEQLRPAVEAMQQGRLGDAIRHCEQTLAANPQDLGAIHMLSTIHARQGRLDDAIVYYNKGLKLAPDEPSMLCGLASARILQGQADEALDLYDRSLKSAPNNHLAIAGKAGLLERLGRFDEARELLQPIVEAGNEDMAMATVYARLLAADDQPQQAIDLIDRHLASDLAPPPGLANHQDPRARLLYVKGRLLDKLGEHDRAWEAWTQANAIGRVAFDPQNAHRHIAALKEAYSARQLSALPRANTLSELCVFIASMPRTGSTLVEQIIAAHPEARGIGENTQMFARVRELSEETGSPYPAAVAQASQEVLDRLSSRHLSRVKPLAPKAARLVNKNLKNHLLIGLIELLLPKSRIIHLRRDPMDTCLSCFMAPLNSMAHPYATDIRLIAEQLRAFDDIMAHWAQVSSLPILTIDYEELVNNPTEISRKIIEFCGLPWDDACLNFHETAETNVSTESYDQVRKPVYTEAAGRWKNYEQHLAPARDVLAQATAGVTT